MYICDEKLKITHNGTITLIFMAMKRFHPLLLFGALTVTGLAVWAQAQSSPAKLDFRMPETQQKSHVPMVAPDVSANGFLTPLATFSNPF